MFNKDFFPTPIEVLDMMQIDCSGKVILEPQAGKGNIVEYLKQCGAKDIITCEKNEDLAQIIKTKSHFLKHDFFKVKSEEISHVELIVMNPPFSNGVKHVLHAWEVAPGGCEIISLINHDNLKNDYSRERSELLSVIKDYGHSTYLGEVFSEAERITNVPVGLIKLYKPNNSNNEKEFEGFFLGEDEGLPQENGIMRYDAIRDVVQRYVGSVKCFDEHLLINEKMNRMNNLFDVEGFTFRIGYDNSVTTKEEYKKEMQKKAWKYLFNVMNLDKYVTSGVMKDINSFVENQTKVPFTMKNIYRMFDIIVGTREQTFNRSLEEVINKFTEHTHENRYNVEGWKTNSGHLLNRKIIVPYAVVKSYSNYLECRYSGYNDKLEDLIKVLCNLTATNYDSIPSLYNFCRDTKMQPNVWYDWGFFEIKGFLKGTLHMKFKDEKTWEIINRAYGKIKGFALPEKF